NEFVSETDNTRALRVAGADSQMSAPTGGRQHWRPRMPKQEPRAGSVLKLKIAVAAAAALGAAVAAPRVADAFTRILWNTNKLAVVVGRTMDWPESTHPILTMLPRGMSRDGGRAGPQVVVADNPARWTSKYASLVTSIYGIGTADGLNERG